MREELAVDVREPGRDFALSTTSAIYLGFPFRTTLDLVALLLLTEPIVSELASASRSAALFESDAVDGLALPVLTEESLRGIGGGVGSLNKFAAS